MDTRADIWGLGATLYEMAAGTRAFDGTSPASVISAVLHDEPRPMTDLQPLTSPGLEYVVRQCLVKEPDDRWQSAGDLKRALEWMAAGGLARAGGEALPVRRRIGASVWVAAAVLSVGLAASWLVSASRAGALEDRSCDSAGWCGHRQAGDLARRPDDRVPRVRPAVPAAARRVGGS